MGETETAVLEVLTGLGDAQRWEPLPEGEALEVGYTYRRGGREGQARFAGAYFVTAWVWHEHKSRQMTGADFVGDGCSTRALEALNAWLTDGTPPVGDLAVKPKPKPEPPPADEVATLRAEVERLRVDLAQAREQADRAEVERRGLADILERERAEHYDYVAALHKGRVAVEDALRESLQMTMTSLRYAVQDCAAAEHKLAREIEKRELGEEVDA